MKKIILILFLFLSCYLIYNLTEKKELSYVVLGDLTSFDNYNNDYTNNEYRIIDLINLIKYHDNNDIHRTLKNTDILIISIGMNDLYYKLNTNKENIYRYLNNMVNNIDNLFKEINKYQYKKVLFLGYYNITNTNNDLFTYMNYKINKLTNKYQYEYIELNKILKNKPKYYQNHSLSSLLHRRKNETLIH